MEEFATPQEIAGYLKVSLSTLRVWAHRKVGPPYIQVEGCRRYEWSAVRAWVEARRVDHTQAGEK